MFPQPDHYKHGIQPGWLTDDDRTLAALEAELLLYFEPHADISRTILSNNKNPDYRLSLHFL